MIASQWGRGHDAGERRPLVRAVIGGVLALALAAGLAVGLDVARADAPRAEAATVYGRIVNGAGRCLDNLNNGTAVNNKIQINVCGTAPAQQWSRQPDTTLRTPAGRCIEPYRSATAENTPVVLVACVAGATQQQWTFYGNAYLINKRTNKCLTYAGNNANGSWAATATCRAVVAHRWTVPAVSTPNPPPTTTTTVPPTTTTVPPTTTTTVPPTTTTTVPPTTTSELPPTTTTSELPPTTTTSELPPTTTTSELPPTTTTTVPPTTTTTTPPGSVPPPFRQTGTTVWRADLTKADVVQAGFINRSANRQLCDGAYNNPNLPWPIKIQAAPGGRAGRAVPYTLPDCAIRLETEPNHRVFVEGDDYYFGFAFYLADNFPLDTTSWQVIEQLHGAPGTGSPPVSFQAAKGGLLIDGGANKPGATSPGQYAYQRKLMPLERGRWYNVVYRVVFSADPTKSWVSVWVNGQNVLENFQPPCATVYPRIDTDRAGTYRKQGLYHFKDIPGGTIWQAGHKLGTGYDAADPSK